MNPPILLALQFSPDDKAFAMSLASLIADMEEGRNEYAGFLFSSRYDTSPDPDIVQKVAQKFSRTYTYRCTRQCHGWPDGPNNVALETYGHYVQNHRVKAWPFAAIMFLEPDCIPLSRDWVKKIWEEWHSRKQDVLGPWLTESDCGYKHINGNCLIGPEFIRKVKSFTICPQGTAWDGWYNREMMEYGKASSLIWSDYWLDTERNPWGNKPDDYFWQPFRYKGTDHPLYGQDIRPVWLHGIKTMRGQKLVRQRFGL